MGPIILAQIISAHREEKVHPQETTPRWLEDKGHHEQVKSIDEHPDLTYEKAMSYSNRGYYAETFEAFGEEAEEDDFQRYNRGQGQIDYGAESDDYLEGVEKGIPMGYCEGCSHAYPLEDMNERGMCEECEGVLMGAETFGAKGIDTFAEPFEDIGISKPYARLGVIAAGITALAFGVKKLRK
jgi:hypothetical protein